MSVTLSPLAGAGWQFFDNNGIPLSGGLLYSYASGTSTQLATYTTISGNVANSNPIVLDSSGRPPQEIWITTGYGYKFVLQNSSGAQIWSYDNIPSNSPSPFANDASNIAYEQGYTVNAGFFVVGRSYLITSVGTTNFVSIGASANTVGIYFTATGVGSGTGTAQLSRTVQAKFQDSISVKDFGAVGDGSTDDTNAILSAISAMPSNGANLLFPQGTYIVNSNYVNGLKFNGFTNFSINGYGATIKVANGAAVTTNHEVMFFINCSYGTINGLIIDGNRANRTPAETASHCLSITDYCSQIIVNDVICKNSTTDGFFISTTVVGTQASYPTDIVLNNCIADNAYRNGLSVIGSLRLSVLGGEYKNTNGTSPQNGIDVEPDSVYTYGNQYLVVDGARLFNNTGTGITVTGINVPSVNSNVLITNVVGSNNTSAFIKIASCNNPTIRNVICENHSTATRGLIDVGLNGASVTNPIIDGVDFKTITATTTSGAYCLFMDVSPSGDITGIPSVNNINFEAISCPAIYSNGQVFLNNIYASYCVDSAITLNGNYSVLNNATIRHCQGSGGRAIYVAGTDVVLENITLIDCGDSSSRMIQIQGTGAIINNLNMLINGARPANLVGLYFAASCPALDISNVLANASSSNFTSAISFYDSTAVASHMRNVVPSPFVISTSWTIGTIANNASTYIDVSVPGVPVGAVTSATLPIGLAGAVISSSVLSAGTIRVVITNNTGGSVTFSTPTSVTVWAELF